jgi:dephospho-CoA kinase
MKDKKYLVGLTGGIGSGKSTIANSFKKLGIKVVDADYASRAVVEPGSEALSKIEAYFQPLAVDTPMIVDGKLNRSALRNIVFNDVDKKEWLEALLHPLISQWIDDQIGQSTESPYIILESPLLFETEQHNKVNTALLVDIPPELQIQRAMQRDKNSADQIQGIIDSQMSRKDKLNKATYIFDNSQDIKTIDGRVLTLHQQFLSLAEST